MGLLFSRDEIFVVDDCRMTRAMVCDLLVRLGCEPVPLDSGAACLEALGQRVPSLVLMDLRMEGMQGDEACRRVKAHPAARDVPVVMLTGASAPHEVMLCSRAGADDFLPKPVDADALTAKVLAVRAAREYARQRPPAGLGVLLAEGSRSLGAFLGGALQHEGFHVLCTGNPKEALAQATEHEARVDSLVIDVSRSFTSGDGMALAARFRELCPRKPMVLVSSVEEPTEVHARAQELSGGPLLERRHLTPGVLVARVLERIHPGLTSVRAAERVPLFSVVEFSARSGSTLTGFSSDASPEGLFVRTLTPARSGTRLSLQVMLAGQRAPSAVEALVAWSNPLRGGSAFQSSIGMGLRLERVDTHMAMQLQRFVPRSHGFSLASPRRPSTF
ncbi:TIGR02266 family protein [Stigmatella aurantiaca]|uniref:Response regulator n=1 Tax=Stigmatella aurantiaca (strain DW4/3-1) TaxID=378806 RepID=Q094K6_STIAD|nr:TIGR02266 family protein [Stigmatella aurantiaca]ADO68605.1 Response regulator [Stigmatella aurantiaca DW4/3-1]EAU67139.1 response regulator/ggdef domain protein, putative [Stigmatella aurantiaca DW4/3-1]